MYLWLSVILSFQSIVLRKLESRTLSHVYMYASYVLSVGIEFLMSRVMFYQIFSFVVLFVVHYQIEAIANDALSNGCISNIDALNIRLENQVLWF